VELELTLVIAVGCTYVLHHYIDTIAHVARISGKLSKQSATGLSIYNSLIVLSRLLLAIMLPSIALLIDVRCPPSLLLGVFWISQILVFIITFYSLLKIGLFVQYFSRVIFFLKDINLIAALFKSVVNSNFNQVSLIDANMNDFNKLVMTKTFFVALIANVFLSSGFYISFLVAYKIPEYQLSLSQLSFAIHGVGAIINAVFIEYKLGQQNDDHNARLALADDRVIAVIFGRASAFLLSSVVFFAMWMH